MLNAFKPSELHLERFVRQRARPEMGPHECSTCEAIERLKQVLYIPIVLLFADAKTVVVFPKGLDNET